MAYADRIHAQKNLEQTRGDLSKVLYTGRISPAPPQIAEKSFHLRDRRDPVAYAQEQATATNAAGLVFPIEILRGALWALLAVPAIMALPFGWKKTGLVIGLLLAVPLSLTLFLSTTMATSLQVAHATEIFGENMIFGLAPVWILQIHSRLPSAHDG